MATEPIPINSRVRIVRGAMQGAYGIVDESPGGGDSLYRVTVLGWGRLFLEQDDLQVIPEPTPPPPTMEDLLAGIRRWQQAGELRRASISLTGHVVEVWLTVLPDTRERRMRFFIPFSANQAAIICEGVANGPPGLFEYVDARSQLVADMGAMSRPVYSVDGGDIDG